MSAEVPFYWVLVAILATVVFGSFLGSWLRGDHSPLVARDPDEPPEGQSLSLDSPWMQAQLQALIDRHALVGSCNIRDGRVMRCVRPGERNAFAAALVDAVNDVMTRTGQNPELAIYTYREGRVHQIGGLSLADLLGLALMLEPEL